MKSNVSEVLKKKNNICYEEKVFFSLIKVIMSLLRILAQEKTTSTLTSSNQQTSSTNSTPNIEPPSLFPTQDESGNSSFMSYLLGTSFFSQFYSKSLSM